MEDDNQQAAGSDLREFLRPIWRQRWLVAFIVIVTTVATYAYDTRKPDQFRSSTQIFLQASQLDESLYGIGGPSFADGPQRHQSSQPAADTACGTRGRQAHRVPGQS